MVPVLHASASRFRIGTVFFLAIGVLPGGPGPALAQNFTCADRSLVVLAERARDCSSTFWLGRRLAARWSAPCPIQVHSLAGPSWGNTRFTFSQGEVFGWQMQVAGTREAIAGDVIPHEVDHMVRASLARRPIARWLDEGCAALFESPHSHQRLREASRAVDPSELTAGWLNATHYPPTAADRGNLYALGFVLTEFLLEKSSPQRLLAFQKDPRPPTEKLAEHFNLSPDQLRRQWSAWHSVRRNLGCSCEAVGCLMHCPILPPAIASDEKGATKQQLTVWTSRWCGPCRVFWTDWNRDAAFRARIQSEFQVVVKDVVLSPHEASAHNVTSVPLFELTDRRIAGYQGTGWLLDQLGLTGEPSPPPKPLASPALPATPPARPPASLPRPGGPTAASSEGFATSSSSKSPRGTAGFGRIVSGLHAILALLPVFGGTLAAGGVGGILMTLATVWIKRRLADRSEKAPPVFRKVDEARQLLALRQSEGGAPALDALRGMFLSDELEKLSQSPDPAAAAIARQLSATIDHRIDEVAPLQSAPTG